ncbi:subtype B tannase [Levilactobacillus suantsaiihabitans]|uniref:subtype B tannase n=1 Tax=Levilactobacillus suantsaiihabitans TaxID=2487722 RepID=UPI001CDB600C|nr:subtype B tannase [Levilactobacillus suantsaiihabitans]
MIRRKMIALSLAMTAVLSLSACSSNQTAKKATTSSPSGTLSQVTYKHKVSYYRGGTTYSGKTRSLKLNTKKYTTKTITVNKQKIKVRCYTNLVYVSKPVNTKYQSMNIYVPEKYFHNKKINGYSKSTAPIFMPNNIGGYMAGTAGTLTAGAMSGGAPAGNKLSGKMQGSKPTGKAPSGSSNLNANGGASSTSATQAALAKGYVVAAPGARGRDTKQSGKYTGKAPAAIVDLKAAVRYLKFNQSRLAGNTNKIISDGTSAGGAMSALLGSTGNNAEYKPYLKAIGAANTSDSIFAAFVFAPITNLNNANTAYEWEFNGVNNISGASMTPGASNSQTKLTNKQKKLSKQLKQDFVSYVNQAGIKANGQTLKLNSDGTGSFATLIKKEIMNSAQTALNKGITIKTSKYPWLTIKNGKVTDVNLTKYFKSVGRSKTPPAFDALNVSQAENIEFGDSTTNAKHFTKFSQQRNTKSGATMADSSIIKLMNPMAYIGRKSQATMAKHFWIRYGETDSNTSVAVPTLLAQKLKNAGVDVNYHVQWNTGHAGDYDMTNMFMWVDSIAK